MDDFKTCVDAITNALLGGRQILITANPEALLDPLVEATRDALFNCLQRGTITWEQYEIALSNVFSGEYPASSRGLVKERSQILHVQVRYHIMELPEMNLMAGKPLDSVRNTCDIRV